MLDMTHKKNTFQKYVCLSHRGQAQQRAGQLPVVSCIEKQTSWVAVCGVQGECDVSSAVIWADGNRNKVITQRSACWWITEQINQV